MKDIHSLITSPEPRTPELTLIARQSYLILSIPSRDCKERRLLRILYNLA